MPVNDDDIATVIARLKSYKLRACDDCRGTGYQTGGIAVCFWCRGAGVITQQMAYAFGIADRAEEAKADLGACRAENDTLRARDKV